MALKENKEKRQYHFTEVSDVVVTTGVDGIQPTIAIKTKGHLYFVFPTNEGNFYYTDEGKSGYKWDIINGEIVYTMSKEDEKKHCENIRRQLQRQENKKVLDSVIFGLLQECRGAYTVLANALVQNYRYSRITKTVLLQALTCLDNKCKKDVYMSLDYKPDINAMKTAIKTGKVAKSREGNLDKIIKDSYGYWENYYQLAFEWLVGFKFNGGNPDYYLALFKKLDTIIANDASIKQCNIGSIKHYIQGIEKEISEYKQYLEMRRLSDNGN